jgi:5,10-methylenetetrahydrofolate reductase
LRLGEKLARGVFATIVEVLPPSFDADGTREPLLGLDQKTRDFVSRVRKVEELADAFLVADPMDFGRLRLSSIYSAAVLKRELGVEAVPAMTARDVNRVAARDTFLTALACGLDTVFLAWGDKYIGEEARNVHDFASLGEMIREFKQLSRRANVQASLLAPVDITSLSTERGLRLARSRLKSGASFFLAQPPTSEATVVLKKHEEALALRGLREKVLLNVFPFRSLVDIESCRSRFGWEIPRKLEEVAVRGEASLLKEARRVVEEIRNARLPGVYVSTRGRPELARYVLES